MKKYFQILKLTCQEYLIYRLNFIIWRFRNLVFFGSFLFFWLAIYGQKSALFGYQKSQMINYVLGAVFLDSIIIFSSRTTDLAGQIKDGVLSKMLLQPLNIFKIILARDITDKIINFIFSVIEISVVLYILKIPFSFPKEMLTILIFLLQLVISFFLYFVFSTLLSSFAFWTEDVWATRFLFGVILLNFLSGVTFPLDILPPWLFKIIYLTPFPYLIYFPLKIWLGQLSVLNMVKSVSISFCWLILLVFVLKKVWQKGLRKYGAYGG